MGAERTADLWWKHAVVHCLDVETYVDSDGDGHGDLDGLLSRIDHLASMGVSCLWLMPFHPTPNRDDGYDISDYYGVADDVGDVCASDGGLEVSLPRYGHLWLPTTNALQGPHRRVAGTLTRVRRGGDGIWRGVCGLSGAWTRPPCTTSSPRSTTGCWSR